MHVGPLTGKLFNLTTYLSGPMDYCENGGRHWRQELRPFLESLNINVLDPTEKCYKISRDLPEKVADMPYRRLLKSEGRYDELNQLLKKMRRVDLRSVDISDFLIVYLDYSIQMGGTYEEIVVAEKQNKPILVVCPQGKKQISDWWFAALDHNYFFDNFEQLKECLTNINNDSKDAYVSDNWVFLR